MIKYDDLSIAHTHLHVSHIVFLTYFNDCDYSWLAVNSPDRSESRRREVDLVDLGPQSKVELFQFQVAAEFFHISVRRICE